MLCVITCYSHYSNYFIYVNLCVRWIKKLISKIVHQKALVGEVKVQTAILCHPRTVAMHVKNNKITFKALISLAKMGGPAFDVEN